MRRFLPRPRRQYNWAMYYGQPTAPALSNGQGLLDPAPGRVVASVLSDTGGKSPSDTPYFDPNFDPNVSGLDGPTGTTAFSNGFSLGFQ